MKTKHFHCLRVELMQSPALVCALVLIITVMKSFDIPNSLKMAHAGDFFCTSVLVLRLFWIWPLLLPPCTDLHCHLSGCDQLYGDTSLLKMHAWPAATVGVMQQGFSGCTRTANKGHTHLSSPDGYKTLDAPPGCSARAATQRIIFCNNIQLCSNLSISAYIKV